MTSIFGFLIILAPLVIVHEFGHFIFAKFFKVKAEAFSIGFGPRVWKRQFGETEFRLSAIPLGGYVKLLGEEPGVELPEEDKHRSLQAQPPWKRFFIFFGGPLFNFLFAILVFMAILAIGEPQLSNYIGRVENGSFAQNAGFVAGDQVLEINGTKITKYKEIILAINQSPKEPMKFVLKSPNQEVTRAIEVVPKEKLGYTIYGEEKGVGEIPGLSPLARSSSIGVSDSNSIAAKNGLLTGDQIVSWNGMKIETWHQLEKAYVSEKSKTVQLEVKKFEKNTIQKIQLKVSQIKKSLSKDFGIYSSELFIKKVLKESPAEGVGLKAGDRIISIGGIKVPSFDKLKNAIQEAVKKSISNSENEKAPSLGIHLIWERNGKKISGDLNPDASNSRDPSLRKRTTYTIGIMPFLVLATPKTVLEREWNPFMLLYKGTHRMVEFSWRNLISIGKMFTGDVSISTLGGPILIGKIAGDSLERGLVAFLTTMAILSVGLGILNILPIPVLDGGHILLLGVEVIRGRPLTIRQMEVVQQVGLSLILLLMVVVMKNDLTRLPIFN